MTFDESILFTTTYFDAFSFPLTEAELWENLFAYSSDTIRTYAFFLETLTRMTSARTLSRTRGMVHVPGREDIVWTRHDREVIAERKYARALRFAHAFSLVPFVRMVAVSNTLAYANASERSDIDFFIIARDGWLWMVRLLCVGYSALCRARLGERRGRHDPICLSYFVSDRALSLERTALPNENGMSDVHLCTWLRHVVPLYDEGGVFNAFMRENEWADRGYAHPSIARVHWRRTVSLSLGERALKCFFYRAMLPFRRACEAMARTAQMRMLPMPMRTLANRGTSVIIDDSMLKFHQNDRREEIRKCFTEALKH